MGKSRHRALKIAVMGSGCVGKTTLVQRLVFGIVVETYQETTQDIYNKRLLLDDGSHADLSIVDLGGPPIGMGMAWHPLSERQIAQAESADAIIVCYSITDRASLKEIIQSAQLPSFSAGAIEKYIKVINMYQNVIYLKNGTFIPMILVGTMLDNYSDRAIQAGTARWLAEYMSMPPCPLLVMEVSCLSGKCINVFFELAKASMLYYEGQHSLLKHQAGKQVSNSSMHNKLCSPHNICPSSKESSCSSKCCCDILKDQNIWAMIAKFNKFSQAGLVNSNAQVISHSSSLSSLRNRHQVGSTEQKVCSNDFGVSTGGPQQCDSINLLQRANSRRSSSSSQLSQNTENTVLPQQLLLKYSNSYRKDPQRLVSTNSFKKYNTNKSTAQHKSTEPLATMTSQKHSTSSVNDVDRDWWRGKNELCTADLVKKEVEENLGTKLQDSSSVTLKHWDIYSSKPSILQKGVQSIEEQERKYIVRRDNFRLSSREFKIAMNKDIFNNEEVLAYTSFTGRAEEGSQYVTDTKNCLPKILPITEPQYSHLKTKINHLSAVEIICQEQNDVCKHDKIVQNTSVVKEGIFKRLLVNNIDKDVITEEQIQQLRVQQTKELQPQQPQQLNIIDKCIVATSSETATDVLSSPMPYVGPASKILSTPRIGFLSQSIKRISTRSMWSSGSDTTVTTTDSGGINTDHKVEKENIDLKYRKQKTGAGLNLSRVFKWPSAKKVSHIEVGKQASVPSVVVT